MLIKLISYSIATVSIALSSFSLPNDAKPAKFQVLNIGNGEEPKTLVPQKYNEVACGILVRQLFEGLVKTEDDGKITPASAESWKVSPDGKKYTFYLRKNL